MKTTLMLFLVSALILHSTGASAFECSPKLEPKEKKWCEIISAAYEPKSACESSPDPQACQALKWILEGKECLQAQSPVICGVLESGLLVALSDGECETAIESLVVGFRDRKNVLALCQMGSHLAKNYETVLDKIHTARVTQRTIKPILMSLRKTGNCCDMQHGVLGKTSGTHLHDLTSHLNKASEHLDGPTNMHHDEYKLTRDEERKVEKWALAALKLLWKKQRKSQETDFTEAKKLLETLTPKLARTIHFLDSHGRRLRKVSRKTNKDVFYSADSSVDGFKSPLDFIVHTDGRTTLFLDAPIGGGGYKTIKLGADLDSGDLLAVGQVIRKDTGDRTLKENESDYQKRKRETIQEMKVQSEASKAIQGVTHAYPAVETPDGKVFTETELADMTLEDLIGKLNEQGRTNINGREINEFKKSVGIKLVSIMADLGKKGINHRDLKPENFLVTLRPDGEFDIQITDFGFAMKLKAGKDNGDKEPSKLEGTPPYLAPQLIEAGTKEGGSGKLAQYTNYDGFALGKMLYDLLPRDIEPDRESSDSLDTQSSNSRDSSSNATDSSIRDSSSRNIPKVPPKIDSASSKMRRIPEESKASRFFRLAPQAKTVDDLANPDTYDMVFSAEAKDRYRNKKKPKSFDEVILALVEPDNAKAMKPEKALQALKSIYSETYPKQPRGAPSKKDQQVWKLADHKTQAELIKQATEEDAEAWEFLFLSH